MFDRLEDRRLLTTLTYTGTGAADQMRMEVVGANVVIVVNGVSETFADAQVDRVVFDGMGGADTLTVTRSGANDVLLSGGEGDDTLRVLDTPLNRYVDVETGAGVDSLEVNFDAQGFAGVRPVQRVESVNDLSIGTGGKMLLPPAGDRVFIVESFQLGSGGIEFNDNSFIRRGPTSPSGRDFQRTRLVNGHANGTWVGNGLSNAYTSAVAAGTSRADGLGFAVGSETALTEIHGVAVNPLDFVIRYTLDGDTDLDRDVDFADLVRLAQNYDPTTTARRGWAFGNFNYDQNGGYTDFADLVSLAQNYGTGLTPALSSANASKSRRRAIELL